MNKTYYKPFYTIDHYMIFEDGSEKTVAHKVNVPLTQVKKVKLKAQRVCGFRFNRKNCVYEKQKKGYLECLKFT